MKLDFFDNLSKSGIYALCNEKTKKVYIGSTSSFLTSINRNLIDIKADNHKYISLQDYPDLYVVFLEEINSRNMNPKIRVAYWVDHYKNLGYALYRTYPGLRYKVRIDISHDFRFPNTDPLIYVRLVDRSNKKIVVGIFESMSEANSFVATTYSQSLITTISYMDNNLTNEYRSQFQKS